MSRLHMKLKNGYFSTEHHTFGDLRGTPHVIMFNCILSLMVKGPLTQVSGSCPVGEAVSTLGQYIGFLVSQHDDSSVM